LGLGIAVQRQLHPFRTLSGGSAQMLG
jgi:hypothetical protein